jgi:uncharacterized membrane protein
MMAKLMSDRNDTNRRTLRRLENLLDGVFALSLVLLAMNFPTPDSMRSVGLADFIEAQLSGIVGAVIGLVVILIYWVQSNQLCGSLARTDSKHSSLMIIQVFFVLFYLYTVELAFKLGEGPVLLALQSFGAVLIGVMAAIGWWYASHKRRLLEDEIEESKVKALQLRVLAEPLTALFTIPLAFISPLLWELGWFAYLLFAALLRRSKRFSPAR